MRLFIGICWETGNEIMNDTFKKAVPLLEKLEKAGFEAVFVGGSVRDLLMDRDINDVDIATSATPSEVKGVFRNTVDVGIEHGTVLVIEEGEAYEITTFRAESEYVDNRRPKEVVFIRTLEEDLKRRDFTMNAIAMDRQGQIIDPFNGRESIERAVIDTVGDPDERFGEDALRMMRAVRFVSQLRFACTERVVAALGHNASLLGHISVERITAEFEKTMQGPAAAEALQLLVSTGLYRYLPGAEDKREEFGAFLSKDCSSLHAIEEKWAALSICFGLDKQQMNDFLRSWKLPAKKMKAVKNIAETSGRGLFTDDVELFTAGLETMASACRVHHALAGSDCSESVRQLTERWNRLPIQSKAELAVNGNDLAEWCGKDKGPWIGELLDSIIAKVLAHEVKNEREAIYKAVRECNQK